MTATDTVKHLAAQNQKQLRLMALVCERMGNLAQARAVDPALALLIEELAHNSQHTARFLTEYAE